MDSLPDGCAKQFQQVFGNVSSCQGYRRPVRRRRWRLNCRRVSHEPTFHCSSLLFRRCSTTRAKQHGHERQQHLRRGFRGGFRESPCCSRTPHPLLPPPLQLPCLLVPLSCTPSFTLKDSVIFRRHVLHASHLHSSTHAGIISPTIIYVCLFLGARR